MEAYTRLFVSWRCKASTCIFYEKVLHLFKWLVSRQLSTIPHGTLHLVAGRLYAPLLIKLKFAKSLALSHGVHPTPVLPFDNSGCFRRYTSRWLGIIFVCFVVYLSENNASFRTSRGALITENTEKIKTYFSFHKRLHSWLASFSTFVYKLLKKLPFLMTFWCPQLLGMFLRPYTLRKWCDI